MERLSAEDVHAQKVSELGLDASALDLTSVEAIAGSIRRLAGVLCPCAARSLVRDIVRPLRGLVDDMPAMKALVETTLEKMIAHGDLCDYVRLSAEGDTGKSSLIYANPPSFVPRDNGSAILLGIAMHQLSVLDDEFAQRIEYINHVRRIDPLSGEDLHGELQQAGFVRIAPEMWLKAPETGPPLEHLARFNIELDRAHDSGEIPGLTILDPERPVRYYRGRWVTPRSQTGQFVARRSQAYGSDLWCYVRLESGEPKALVDLPRAHGRWRGCDEAWLLQLAIDASRNNPQWFRLCPLSGDAIAMEFFSPVPMWAQRRWDAVGEPIPRSGCLFAYRLRLSEVEEEVKYAREALWLQPLDAAAES